MNREEALSLTRAYLAHEKRAAQQVMTLDYHWILNSLTEYAACWYVDFRYRYPNGKRQQFNTGAPGFTINKKGKQIQVISWHALYELNQEPWPV